MHQPCCLTPGLKGTLKGSQTPFPSQSLDQIFPMQHGRANPFDFCWATQSINFF